MTASPITEMRVLRKRRQGVLWMAMLVAGASFLSSGCGGDGDPPTSTMGTVGMALTLPSGGDVVRVDFELRNGGGGLVASGSIPVPSPRAVLSAIIGRVPAGRSYVIQLSATDMGGGIACSGSATFDVVASETSSVNVILGCHTQSNNGSVVVDGHLDACPRLTSFTAGPRALPVGQSAALYAAATDPDPADVVTFAWTATSGTFDASAAAKTTFTCTTPGIATISAAVSDGSCSDVSSFDITCLSLCGDGKLDPGEQCDPPNGTTCSSDCLLASLSGRCKSFAFSTIDVPYPDTIQTIPRGINDGGTIVGSYIGPSGIPMRSSPVQPA